MASFLSSLEVEASRAGTALKLCMEFAGLELLGGSNSSPGYRWVCGWEDLCFFAPAAPPTVLFSVLCCCLQPPKVMIQGEITLCSLTLCLELWNRTGREKAKWGLVVLCSVFSCSNSTEEMKCFPIPKPGHPPFRYSDWAPLSSAMITGVCRRTGLGTESKGWQTIKLCSYFHSALTVGFLSR